MTTRHAQRGIVFGCVLLLQLGASTAFAVDGVIEINQARAKAGGVTATDTPGFPVSIDKTGSYRLTGNLDVTGGLTPADAATVTAIDVRAPNVTIDLNGFTISGPIHCTGAPLTCDPAEPMVGHPVFVGQGVAGNSFQGTTVINGTVQGMGASGIQVGYLGRVERVRVFSNGKSGIIADAFSVLSTNVARANGGSGIVCASRGCTLTGNTAGENAINGLTSSGVASGNTALGNGQFGLEGIGVFVGNEARGNQVGLALSASPPAGYTNNVLSNNTSNVTGGINMGHNVCDAALCP